MQRILLTAKIHRATVTDRCIDYEGSIEISEDLMEEVGIIPYEQVHIYDINNGQRFVTYAIPGYVFLTGVQGSAAANFSSARRRISVNGAAARRVERNDRIIIAAYGIMEVNKKSAYQPKVLLLNERNAVVERQGALALASPTLSE
ncbi:MAG: aspartate 1-decarboxylase [Nitrospinaceae bacterium]